MNTQLSDLPPGVSVNDIPGNGPDTQYPDPDNIPVAKDTIDRSLTEGTVNTVGGIKDVKETLAKHKSVKVAGSANMDFIDKPAKVKKEKRDNANPEKPLVTKGDKSLSDQNRVQDGKQHRVGIGGYGANPEKVVGFGGYGVKRTSDKKVGKAGGTRVDVTSGEKVGTESATTPAAKTTSSRTVAPKKAASTPVSRPNTPTATPKKAAGPRPLCLCGCKGTPAGKKSKYLPGHDAKHHSALKLAAAEAAKKKGKVKK